MTEPTTLSVRGEARRDVAPDSARLDTQVRAVEATKAEALHVVAQESRSVLAALERLGGAPLTAADVRRELGWVANGAITWDEHEWRNEQHLPSGRVGASVTIRITLRDFGLIDAVAAVLADHDHVHLDGVAWSVDDDNQVWGEVRAAAITAAVAKGRDYATALGGTLLRVQHVADTGLLGGRDGGWVEQEARAVSQSYKGGGEGADSPPLDPTPQTVRAVIEARFSATVAPLA